MALLTEKTIVQVGNKSVTKVLPHSKRIDFYNNVLGDKMPLLTACVNA